MDYILSQEGDELTPGDELLVAPGVRATIFDTPEGLYIPMIVAEREGSGDVGRFLDTLPTDRRIAFPCVISRRLAGMLVRRGFVDGVDNSEAFGDIEIYERVPASRIGGTK